MNAGSRMLPIAGGGRGSVRWLVVAAGLCVGSAAPSGWAQEQPGSVPAVPAPVNAPSHVITGVVIQYVRDNAANPKPESLLQATVEAAQTQDGWSAPRPRERTERFRLADIPTLKNQRFTDTGLTLLAPAVVQYLKDQGLVGVYVTPDAAQFRVEEGRVVDLRKDGVTTITLQVTIGVVTEVRTVAIGERIEADKTVNNPVHDKIRAGSPVQAVPEGTPPGAEGASAAAGSTPPGTTNLVRRDMVDDYIYRLNRRPGRRADVAVSASGEEPGAITLDYLVTENRPWLLFAQVSSTGTGSTSRFREHFGFVNNDLTHSDDTLAVGYQTANFKDEHSIYGSYDRPFSFYDRLRWRVDGSWYRYLASDVGQPNADFRGEGYNAGASLAWNFYQHHALFLDLVGGAQFKHVRVTNELAAIEGDDDFLVPSVALRLERNTEVARTNALLGVEFNLPGAAGTNSNLDALGRLNAERNYTILKSEATHSFYLEPLYDPNAARTGGLANEILLSAKGQYAFDNRLIPNEEMPVGGLYTVRGYPESIVAGDTAIIGTLEYRYHVPKGLGADPTPGTLFGKPFRYRPQYEFGPTDWDLVLKAFVDGGRVINSNRQSFEADNTLVGAGIGAELAITRRVNLRVDWGFALKSLHDGGGARTVDAGHNELEFVLTLIY